MVEKPVLLFVEKKYRVVSNCFNSFLKPGRRGKKKEKDEPKIKKDYDPEDPDKPYGCESKSCPWSSGAAFFSRILQEHQVRFSRDRVSGN